MLTKKDNLISGASRQSVYQSTNTDKTLIFQKNTVLHTEYNTGHKPALANYLYGKGNFFLYLRK